MILVDTNLLLYAKFRDYPQHTVAYAWLMQQINGEVRIALPWLCLVAFLRSSTHRRLFASPLAASEAWAQVTEWLALPNVWTPESGPRHRHKMAEFAHHELLAGDLANDAYLAALAVDHGLTICSADADFAGFPGVQWHNPLQAQN